MVQTYLAGSRALKVTIAVAVAAARRCAGAKVDTLAVGA